ncbi:CGNR zinc finger domain-containing protein [Amycolatopsis albispora]|uniref:Zinc finger CGNR domain-containing protein n=1 Tax=Amycolatopsis albispora TaxID=1804986 RepID=A0A344L3K9_9PSEU|nr:CGNR zinc finger domain-containing protein [Amycolatopsis albispora]AXB42633.1 hypothetical protein A4R43_08880 [Amycolatopsis albispora]
MHFNPYGGAAAQVAAGLVNLGHAPAGELVAMMRSCGMTLRGLTAPEAAAAAEWGDRLRPVFAESDVDRRVELVNELLADSACRPFISRHDGLPAHLHYASEHSGTLRRLQAYTAGGLAHLLCEEPERLGGCAREGCGTVYVDTSRNGRRRFCTTKCANRVYVTDHRNRRRAG